MVSGNQILPDVETVHYTRIYYDFPQSISIQTGPRHKLEGLTFVFFSLLMPFAARLMNEPLLYLFFPYFFILGLIKVADFTSIKISQRDRNIHVLRKNLFGIKEIQSIPFAKICMVKLHDLLEEPLFNGEKMDFHPYQLQIFFEKEHAIQEMTILSGKNGDQMQRIFRELKGLFSRNTELGALEEMMQKFNLSHLDDYIPIKSYIIK